MIIKESQGDFRGNMPLIIQHYYDYNGDAPYSNTPAGKYRLLDYQSDTEFCQIIVEEHGRTRDWVVAMKYLTYFGPSKEIITTNEGAVHLLKGEYL